MKFTSHPSIYRYSLKPMTRFNVRDRLKRGTLALKVEDDTINGVLIRLESGFTLPEILYQFIQEGSFCQDVTEARGLSDTEFLLLCIVESLSLIIETRL